MNTQSLLLTLMLALAPAALMAADPAPQGSQKTEAGQYVSDAAITAKVKTAFIAEKNLKSLDINVETQNGVVQLAGYVISSAQMEQAEDVARHVKGVKEVKNDLRLKTDTQG